MIPSELSEKQAAVIREYSVSDANDSYAGSTVVTWGDTQGKGHESASSSWIQ
jgi:hypothetical protein